jgi:hypothetical protein
MLGKFVPPGRQTVNQEFFIFAIFCTFERAESLCNTRVIPRQVDPALRQLAFTRSFPLRNFWRKNVSWSWNTPLTQESSLLVTPSSSLSWRIISRNHILKPWKKVGRLRQPFSATCREITSGRALTVETSLDSCIPTGGKCSEGDHCSSQ